jgi:para-aminobenzoate synthetase component I
MKLPKMPGIEIKSIDRIENSEEAEFLDYAEAFAAESPSIVLLSGGELAGSGENRFSIVGCRPLLTLSSKGGRQRVEIDGKTLEFRANPLDLLEEFCAAVQPAFGEVAPPFSGGALGYLAYDLKNAIERLPGKASDDLELPDLFLIWPGRIAIHDRLEKTITCFRLEHPGCSLSDNARPSFPKIRVRTGDCIAGRLQSNFSHPGYLAAVSKVRRYIRQGDVYQVNLSQRFQFPLAGDPYGFWKMLYHLNPAPFYAFINAGDHHVLSTSMERFLFRRNSYIETRPIKGTRPRGGTEQEDRRLISELLASPKDDAELSMIVDLLRNDLGRVCLPGTVRVAEHKRLETYRNVHHLVSMVTGELPPGLSHPEIIRAAFPGGSVTGCPKIRAMEIIDELEPNVRHVYTGAIGYLGWHENLDLNVAIRTAIVKDGSCYFSVGGGIVYDSDEEEEYRETLHKGRTLFELLERIGERREFLNAK